MYINWEAGTYWLCKQTLHSNSGFVTHSHFTSWKKWAKPYFSSVITCRFHYLAGTMVQLEFRFLVPYLQLQIYLKKSDNTSSLGRMLKKKILLDNFCTWFFAKAPQVMATWLLGAEKAFDMRQWLFSNNFNLIPTLYVGQSALCLSIWGCKDLWCHLLIFPTGPRQEIRKCAFSFVVLQDQRF